MKILVKGIRVDGKATISQVFVDGELMCFSIEDPVRESKIKGQTAIPAGTYKVGLRNSPRFSGKFKHDMLWVQNVPGFEFILIHWGNTVDDTEGCLLVGQTIGVIGGKVAVLNSQMAYLRLYNAVKDAAKAGELVIEYVR